MHSGHTFRTARNGRRSQEGTGAHLVGVLERPAVDAVVGRVETALGEPDDVAVFERARADGAEGAVPVQELPCHLQESSTMSRHYSSIEVQTHLDLVSKAPEVRRRVIKTVPATTASSCGAFLPHCAIAKVV